MKICIECGKEILSGDYINHLITHVNKKDVNWEVLLQWQVLLQLSILQELMELNEK